MTLSNETLDTALGAIIQLLGKRTHCPECNVEVPLDPRKTPHTLSCPICKILLTLEKAKKLDCSSQLKQDLYC